MAFNLKEILGEAGSEVGERYVHMKLAEHLREEIAKGESSQDVVAQAIIRLRNNEYLQNIKRIFGDRVLGLTLTGLGAFIASALKSIDFGNFLSEDQSAMMREVRFILQHLAPALIVGAVEGGVDTFEDDVHAAVAKIRSNSKSSDLGQKPGSHDFAYEIQVADGVDYAEKYGLLFPELDANGNLQYDSLGAVILAGAQGKKFADDWYAAHKSEWRDVPIEPIPDNNQQNQQNNNRNNNRQYQQNNQQPRTKRQYFPAVKYEGRLVPLATAIMRLPQKAPMDPEVRALAIASLKPKDPPPAKKEGLDALSEKGRDIMRLLSLKVATRAQFEQKLIVDLAEDIAANATKINHLGDLFVTDANKANGFSDDEYAAVRAHLQMWLGSKLTIENRVLLALDSAKAAFERAKDDEGKVPKFGKRLETAVGEFANMVGEFSLGSLIVGVSLFAMFLMFILIGAFGISLDEKASVFSWFTASTGTKTLSFAWSDFLFLIPSVMFSGLAIWKKKSKWFCFLFVNLAFATGIPALVILTTNLIGRLAPNEFAIALVAGGGILACAELLSFTAIQALLSLVTRFFPNLEKDWLVNKGRVLIMFIAIHVGIFIILLSLKVPLILRFLICVPTFFALASQMGLSGYEFGEEARLRARKTLRLFSALTSVVFVVVVIIIIFTLQNKSFEEVVKWITDSKLLLSLIILSVSGFIVAKVVRRMEEVKRVTRNGIPTEIQYKPNGNWLFRGIGISLVLLLTSWPWVGSEINKFFDQNTATTTPVPPAAPSGSGSASTASVPPVIVPTVVSTTPSPTEPVRRSSGHTRKTDKVDLSDCPRLSFESKRALGCP